MTKNVLGQSSPVETGIQTSHGDRESVTVEVEGRYSELAIAQAAAEQYVPSGYVYDSHSLVSTGNGHGKLSVKGIQYNFAAEFSAERTTFNIDMAEVSYDLQNHPHVSEDDIHVECVQWISDGCIFHNDKFWKKEASTGAEIEITEAKTIDFCRSYESGIKSYVRYYPVISRIEYYKNPPGMSINGKSFSGGTVRFSNKAGKFDAPPLQLNGYPSSNWFMSKDSWEELANKSWRRTTQWTYTPDGPQSDNGWIYSDLPLPTT